jgi:hypothetical protein
MLDIIAFSLVALFFAIALLYTRACDALKGKRL